MCIEIIMKKKIYVSILHGFSPSPLAKSIQIKNMRLYRNYFHTIDAAAVYVDYFDRLILNFAVFDFDTLVAVVILNY